jgi:HAD superfamily hydrolase (TIGR01549 family)
VSLSHPLFHPGPIKGVLFDFHSTLVDQGSSENWLQIACERVGLDPLNYTEIVPKLNSIVEFARIEDPHHERDLSESANREIFTRLLRDFTEEPLASALYATITETWFTYEDTLPVLDALREQKITTAIVSNMAFDLSKILSQMGISECVDHVFTSAELGYVKPNPGIFLAVCDSIGIGPENLLMVGDNAIDDAGAGAVGIRTLILPRTAGPIHGLATVLGVVAGSRAFNS